MIPVGLFMNDMVVSFDASFTVAKRFSIRIDGHVLINPETNSVVLGLEFYGSWMSSFFIEAGGGGNIAATDPGFGRGVFLRAGTRFNL